jgi:hypothetical protein
MRPEPWLVIGPMAPRRHPPIRSGSSTPRLSELMARMEQLAQRLQRFQHRYGTQLSHADQGWLYQAQQQVAFYLAELSQLDDTRGVTPEDQGALQEVKGLEPLARQIAQLAEVTAQLVQTMPLPHQEIRQRGRAAAGGRVRHSTSKGHGAAVHAIVILLGRNEQQEAHEEAENGAAGDPTNGLRGPLADHGAGTPEGQTGHNPEGPSTPFVPQHEPHLRTYHTNPGTRARRYHEMSLEEQLEILGRLRRRIERS